MVLGRDTIVRTLTAGMTEDSPHFVGRFRAVETAANRQPAVAVYRCPPGEHVFRPFALNVLRVEGDQLAEITSFVDAGLFAKFGLPESRWRAGSAMDRRVPRSTHASPPFATGESPSHDTRVGGS